MTMNDRLYSLIDAGRWQLSLAVLDGAPSSGKTGRHAPVERGLILNRLGQRTSALREYLRGLSADPENRAVLDAALSLAIEEGDESAIRSLVAHILSGPFADASPTVLAALRQLKQPFGVVQIRNGIVSGWAVGRGKALQVESQGQRSELQAAMPTPQLLAAGIGDGANGFAFAANSPACIRLGMEGVSLWGSPVVHPAERYDLAASPPQTAPMPGALYILIPVFGDEASLRRCLDSIASSANLPPTQVWVIEDCPADERVKSAVREKCQKLGFRLLSRSFNAGFSAAVNSAMRVIPMGDLILLNSDTIVCGDWATRLQSVAYAASDIATVTPLSNNGELLSHPHPMRASPCRGEEAVSTVALLDRLCRKNKFKPVDIPTGVGFCLFIRADARQAAGDFDELTFRRGYGEDTDYCLRLACAGWRHVVAPNVFVGHEGSVSFGSDRTLLAARNTSVLLARYPGHGDAYSAWLSNDPLSAVRSELQRAAVSRLLPSIGLDEVFLGVRDDLIALQKQTGRSGGSGSPGLQCPVMLDDTALPAAYLMLTSEKAELHFLNVPMLDRVEYPYPSTKKTLFSALSAAKVRTLVIHSLTPSVLQLLEVFPSSFKRVFSLDDASGFCLRGSAAVDDGRPCQSAQMPIECDACVARLGPEVRSPAGTAAWRRRVDQQLGRASRILIDDANLGSSYLRHFPNRPIEISEVSSDGISPAGLVRRFGSGANLAVVAANSPEAGWVNLEAILLESFRLAPDLRFLLLGQCFAQERLASFENVFLLPIPGQPALAERLRQHHCRALLVTSLAPGADRPWAALAQALDLPLVKVVSGALS